MPHTPRYTHRLANDAPIGLFDSGVGGLSVYQHVQKLLPNERFIYYADSKNLPYGDKPPETIADLTRRGVAWLVNRGVKMVVIACNSASSYALPVLRQKYSLPIVGLVPALKPACAISQSRHIVVLATQSTLASDAFDKIVSQYVVPQGIRLQKHFDPALVPWVEAGMPQPHPVADSLRAHLHHWHSIGADTLVLGCTHYPFFKTLLQDEINAHHLGITLIDSGQAIALRVQSLLTQFALHAPNQHTTAALQFYASNPKSFATAEQLLGQPLQPMI